MRHDTASKALCKRAILAPAGDRPFLSAERVEHECRLAGHTWRDSFWSPFVTLLACLLQTLGGSKSLRSAVADVIGEIADGRGACARAGRTPSHDPAAFAQARRRLPLAVFSALQRDVTARISALGAGDRWRGRRVVVVDGTGVSMPDTPELQAAFPQPGVQKPGCGFPVARIVCLFSWATGALFFHRVGSLRQSELILFREILNALRPGDVVVADRHYSSYIDIARLRAEGVDTVIRMHHGRPADFRAGTRLGRDDAIVTWTKPGFTVSRHGLSREEHDALPAEMRMRIVRVRVTQKGFRTKTIVVATTILDPREASVEDLTSLYRDRWHAELNLRSLKATLGMDVLRGKSVDVVTKEITLHATVYNLIRLLMLEAAALSGASPRRLSFAGTLHRLRGVAGRLLLGGRSKARKRRILAAVLRAIAADLVPDRADRFEPRRVKRRKKNYHLLTKPRSHYHAKGDKRWR